MAQNLNRGTPARLLVLLVLLTGLVVVSAWRDALQRPVTGKTRYPTAAGDTAFFTPGTTPLQVSAAGRLIELRESPEPPQRRREDRMFRLYPETPLSFRLYTDREFPAPGTEPPLFAHLSAGKFIRLQARLLPRPPAEIPVKSSKNIP